MRTWEYMILDSRDVPSGGIFSEKDRAEIDQYLNDLGQQGWEVVNLDFRELERRMEFIGVAKRETRSV